MKKYIGILKNTKLFAGAGEEEIQAMLSCLGAVLHHYKKGTMFSGQESMFTI